MMLIRTLVTHMAFIAWIVSFGMLPVTFLQAQLPEAHPFYHTKSEKWGIVDTDGKVLLNPIIDKIQFFKNQDEQFIKFEVNGKTGVINQKAHIVFEPIERKVEVKGPFAYFYDDEKSFHGIHVIYLPEGKEILTQPAQRFVNFIDTKKNYFLMSTLDRQLYFLYNAEGKLITSHFSSDWALEFAHDTCPLFSVNFKLKQETTRYFDCCGETTEKEYKAKFELKKEKFTAVPIALNDNVKLTRHDPVNDITSVIPADKHKRFEEFKNKFPQYSIQGVHEQNGNVTSLVVYTKPHEYGLIDLDGNILLPLKYGDITAKNQYLEIRSGSKRGVANSKGEIVVPLIVEKIELYLTPGPNRPYAFQVLGRNGYRGYASEGGKVFLPKEALTY